MTIDIVCKVVDNFGDIGVVFRLAKALSAAMPSLKLRIIVDNLQAFHALEPAVHPEAAMQRVKGWTVVQWNKPCDIFLSKRPRFIVEAFACGRPDWYEAILFDETDAETRILVNLEYLSAEAYTEEMHRIPSLTRSPLVKKYMFMPGFSPKTGGLIIDPEFRKARARLRGDRASLIRARAGFCLSPDHPIAGELLEERYWISVFSYEHDYEPIIRDLVEFNESRPLVVLLADGRGADCFKKKWLEALSPFPLIELPFLPQARWDEILLASDFSIIRGEESLARAALSGHPFLWHAYLQDKGHHLVKVEALLDRMEPFFSMESFACVRNLFLLFNKRDRDHDLAHGNEKILPVLRESTGLSSGFSAFAEFLMQNGDLAQELLTFFRTF